MEQCTCAWAGDVVTPRSGLSSHQPTERRGPTKARSLLSMEQHGPGTIQTQDMKLHEKLQLGKSVAEG